jgi:hypothetical protein
MAGDDMRTISALVQALTCFACLLTAILPAALLAQSSPPAQKPTVFRVKYISENSVYVDAGCNADIQEGMKFLSLNRRLMVSPPTTCVSTDT